MAQFAVLSATVEDVALMKSANREKILIEGAKKEGKVSLYTGLIVDQVVRPVKDAFEKYPFLRLNSSAPMPKGWRSACWPSIRPNAMSRSSAAPAAVICSRTDSSPFYSPPIAEYPPELKDAKGFWGSTNVYFMTLGYNTRAVKPGELPKAMRIF